MTFLISFPLYRGAAETSCPSLNSLNVQSRAGWCSEITVGVRAHSQVWATPTNPLAALSQWPSVCLSLTLDWLMLTSVPWVCLLAEGR